MAKGIKLRIIEWLIRNTPPCKEVTEMVSRSFEQPLPLARRIQIRMHYWICAWCRRYEQQLKLLHDALHKHPLPDDSAPGPKLSDNARERMKQALRESGE